MTTKNVQITNEEINKTEKELIAKLFTDAKVYENNKDMINALIDENRIGVFYDEDSVVIVMDAKCLDTENENYLKWYAVAAVFERASGKIVNHVIAEKSSNKIAKFVTDYVMCVLYEFRNAFRPSDSNTPFALINNRICLKGTKDVLIDLDTENNISDVDEFINELVLDDFIPELDGEEIQKKDGVNTDVNDYIFFNKNIADIIAEDLGYAEPKNLYKLLHKRGLIYKTKDSRYSKRVRNKKLQKRMGNEQLIGIKKSVYNKVRGVADNDNI